MACFDGYLLVSDIDGTLVDDEKQIPEANSRAIERFKALGGHFTIATGRSQITALDIATRAGINAPMIVYNGGGVFSTTQNAFLWTRTFARDALLSPYKEFIRRHPELGVEVNAGAQSLMVNPTAPIDPLLLRGGYPYTRMAIEDTPPDWFKIMVNAPQKSTLLAVEAELRTLLADVLQGDAALIYSGETYLELLPSNKGLALQNLARLGGYSRERVIAIGDYDNDLEMISWAGLGLAVGNAQPCVHDIADACVCNNAQGAIAHALALLESRLEKEGNPA